MLTNSMNLLLSELILAYDIDEEKALKKMKVYFRIGVLWEKE